MKTKCGLIMTRVAGGRLIRNLHRVKARLGLISNDIGGRRQTMKRFTWVESRTSNIIKNFGGVKDIAKGFTRVKSRKSNIRRDVGGGRKHRQDHVKTNTAR